MSLAQIGMGFLLLLLILAERKEAIEPGIVVRARVSGDAVTST